MRFLQFILVGWWGADATDAPLWTATLSRSAGGASISKATGSATISRSVGGAALTDDPE